MLRNLRLFAGTILYLFIVFILLLVFHYKFSGFSGFVALVILGIGSHAFMDYVIHRIKKKFKRNKNISA